LWFPHDGNHNKAHVNGHLPGAWQNSGVAPLAQSEEQWTFNPRVLGSKPRGGTSAGFA
jgi:hypothetical protein